MPEFLELLPPAEALKRWLDSIAPGPLGVERIAAQDSLDRVTAEAICSPEALPAFPRSTVDGYAVRAADTHGASDSLPAYFQISGEVPMGGQPDFHVVSGTAALIHTGGMLPQGADAVVMLENTQASRPGEIEVLRAVAAAENILQAGEDVQTGQVVLPAGSWLRPSEIGGLMALGILDIPAAKKPRVGILSSGDEVIPPHQSPVPGQVRDINSYALSALVQRAGGVAERLGIVPDRADALRTHVRRALDTCDLVVITAGSSASTRDLTAMVLDEMGEPGVLVHGVNVRPGKPTILAVCAGKAAVGLPGNPVSALVIAGLFVVPLIQRLLGVPADRPEAEAQARLTVNLSSQAGREDWVPVKLIRGAQGLLAEPIFYKSNLIFSLARADGLLKIPADANGLAAGELATVKWL